MYASPKWLFDCQNPSCGSKDTVILIFKSADLYRHSWLEVTIKPLHGIWPKYRTHGFVHWFYNLENSIPIPIHACTILENPFPINVHEYYILENPIHINVRTSLQTKITVKLNIKIWKYLLQKCVFCVHFDDFLFDMTHKGIENML